jgi:hypothetical protein
MFDSICCLELLLVSILYITCCCFATIFLFPSLFRSLRLVLSRRLLSARSLLETFDQRLLCDSFVGTGEGRGSWQERNISLAERIFPSQSKLLVVNHTTFISLRSPSSCRQSLGLPASPPSQLPASPLALHQ